MSVKKTVKGIPPGVVTSSGVPVGDTTLREPVKKETRLGWWFMRTFRPKEVAVRSARNRVVGEAYTAVTRYSLPELSAALDAYAAAQDVKDGVAPFVGEATQ